MENKFECSFKTTKENVQEYARHFHFHSLRFLLLSLFMLGYLVWAISMIVRYGWNGLRIFMLVFVLVLYPALLLYRYHKDVKILLARSRELHKGEVATTHTYFTDEEITLIDHDGNRHPFAYENLKKVTLTKNLLLLQSKARQTILCEKESFTAGAWEECVDFLKQKGLKIQKG